MSDDPQMQVKSNVLQDWQPFVVSGKVHRISGFLIEATGLKAKIGSLCQVWCSDEVQIIAEVIGFQADITYLMTSEDIVGISPGSSVIQLNEFPKIPLGDGLLGRVINAEGLPLDSLGELKNVVPSLLKFESINPLDRALISTPIDVGVKCINALLTLGRGQRVGLFAGTGVGKSILLGMITKYSEADVIVISLVGERGREVKEFIEESVGAEALKKTVIVAAPADSSPLSRIKAAETATFIAEHFKNKNKKVLLLMDSITRYAQALRELGLALGEPPTAKGYPPSVFARIPKLIERAGNGHTQESSITGIYTVLTEGDDMNDPVADSARGILDGHITLSRHLAEEGHYPAIDLEQSISRVMDRVVDAEHQRLAKLFKKSFIKYRQNLDYINLGAYQKGADPEMDLILEKKANMYAFLQQDAKRKFDFNTCKHLLKEFECFSSTQLIVKDNG
ncbi:MAG: FliI/YscN family ATPase [Gammaproteobacteria bacterium]|jgi:flagellum-specific ATP synthase|nr:FliI/YscN family ATPase [Gammaproteobacteria bacterium]